MAFHKPSIDFDKQCAAHCPAWYLTRYLQYQLSLQNIWYKLAGYWKDLSWLIKFLVEDQYSMTTKRQSKVFKSQFEQASGEEMDVKEEPKPDSLEDIIRKRVDGTIPKGIWRRFLQNLPNVDARSEAKLKFNNLMKSIHSERSQEAKNKKNAKKNNLAAKLSELTLQENFSSLYFAVVDSFVKALKRDAESLKKNQRLDSLALAGKWAPSIGIFFFF